MRLTVALAAEESAGVQTLRMLADRGHHVVAVFTDGTPAQRGATVAGVAGALGVPVRPAGAVREPATASWLLEQGIELMLNVHSLHIVGPEVLAAPSKGSFNLHPGPLPERAGLNVPSWALYEGAEEHAVSLHRMTPGIDEGAIAFADRFAVGARDNALAVMTQCVRRGVGLVERLLERAERGESIPDEAQDLTRRRWFDAGPPDEGCVTWDGPARRVVDFVRACDYGPFPSPWPYPRTSLGGRDVAIVSAEAVPQAAEAPAGAVVGAEGDAVVVAAADTLVRVGQVEIDGRRAAAAEAIPRGATLTRPATAAERTPA